MKLAELYFPPILLFPSSHTCETASRARVEGPVTIEMLVLKSFYLQNKTQTGTIKLDCLYWLETVSKLILALPASSTHAANIKPRVWLHLLPWYSNIYSSKGHIAVADCICYLTLYQKGHIQVNLYTKDLWYLQYKAISPWLKCCWRRCCAGQGRYGDTSMIPVIWP